MAQPSPSRSRFARTSPPTVSPPASATPAKPPPATTPTPPAPPSPTPARLARRAVRHPHPRRARAKPTAALRLAESEVPGTESYAKLADNPFQTVADQPLSTFSIDVDTASYSNVRRFLTRASCRPPDAVRIEEMVNYFPYDYAARPKDERAVRGRTSRSPAARGTPATASPASPSRARRSPATSGPSRNLVFLIDVSGSMNEPEQAAAGQGGPEAAGQRARPRTTASRSSSTPATPGSCSRPPAGPTSKQTHPRRHRQPLSRRLDQRRAGHRARLPASPPRTSSRAAPTASSSATDGDFNVGITDQSSLIHLIEDKAKSGVFLTVLGFGMGNLKDVDDGEARRQGQRQLRLHRHAQAKPAKCSSSR